MAMEVDSRQQPQLSGLGYGTAMRYPAPQFTNPWVSAAGASSQLYAPSLSNAALESTTASQSHPGRPTSISIPSYPLQVTASPLGAGISLSDGLFEAQNLIDPAQDMMNHSRAFATGYPNSASSTTSGYPPTSATQYTMDYPNHSRSPFAYAQDSSRRSSHPSVPSATFLDPSFDSARQRQSSLVDYHRLNPASQRNSFSEALDASRGMLAMSQDITPRNIYGNQSSSRGSTDSYGFPSTHSAHSSISSASYPYYASSNADGSVTDYSSASESVDNSRTLPRPSGMAGSNAPPAPQSMMGQFSSKVSSSSQKKHKCKICDKRFTRPSSLQTHMYSHTGEKPFACEVEGCGRHFSVVSNLRRHRKVHRGEQDHPSPEE